MHGAVGASVFARNAVVEHGNFAKIGVVQGDVVVDPMAVVLVKQLLVLLGAHVVGLRVSPTPQQLSWREVVVVNDPQFVEGGDAEQEVFEVGVVVDGVDVQPIAGLAAWRAEVDVNLVHVVGDHAEVALVGVVILNQVVPGMPFPNHVCAAVSIGGQLQDHLRPQAFFWHQRGIATCLNGLFRAEMLPGDGKHVAIGLHFDVVVETGRAVVQGVRPQDVVLPCASFNRCASSASPNGV